MRHLAIILLLTFTFFACNNSEPLVQETTKGDCEYAYTETATAEHQIQAIKDFGSELLKELSLANDKNVIISPVSIYSALLLGQEAAACDTRIEIQRSLSLSDSETYTSTSSAYLDLMGQLSSEGPAICKYANALFHDPNRIQVKEAYVNTVEEFYNTEVHSVDFNEDSALENINSWAAENTENRITEVLNELTEQDLAFLLNAIYFIGDWENGFDEVLTSNSQFTLSDNSLLEVPFMSSSVTRAFHKTDNVQLVDLLIKGGDYAVSFLMPTDQSSACDLIQKTDFYEDYLDLVAQAEDTWIGLRLPKFELKGNLSLKDVMKNLGMQTAFIPGEADLSEMTGDTRAYINKILHDTYLKVDEKGIEGAAVTTIGIGVTSAPPTVTFNKPFVLVLRHRETEVPIFLAKVVNPLEK